jgi:dienelactone hydrolase
MMSCINRLPLLAFALCVTVVAPLAEGSSALAQEKVFFPSADDDLRGGTPTRLTGFLYKPEGSGPFPAVVSLHGCNGLVAPDGSVFPLYGSWGEILSRQGYIVLLPDSHASRGQGDLCAIRPGERPVEANRERPRDAYGALAYLRSRPDVRADRIAILGQSAGAAAMFWTIAEDARPKDLSPQQDFRAAVAFYPPCQGFLAREPRWAPRQPLLLLMGEADNFTPAAPCKELLSRVATSGVVAVQMHFYPDTYHAFDAPNEPVRVLTNVKLPPDGHSPTIGTNPKARVDAINRVEQFLTSRVK